MKARRYFVEMLLFTYFFHWLTDFKYWIFGLELGLLSILIYR